MFRRKRRRQIVGSCSLLGIRLCNLKIYISSFFECDYHEHCHIHDHDHHHHHHISVMELGHLLTRSGLTYPEVSSKVYHDSLCHLGSNISLPWVIYFEAFYLHIESSFSCIPVICPKLLLFLTPLQTTESQRYNCFTRNGGNDIPKYAGPEAKGSNPTTGLTLLWACNPFRGNFNHWQVSWKLNQIITEHALTTSVQKTKPMNIVIDLKPPFLQEHRCW